MKLQPHPTEASSHLFLQDKHGTLLGHADERGNFNPALKVGKTISLMGLTHTAAILAVGWGDQTDSIGSATIVALWIQDGEDVVRKELNAVANTPEQAGLPERAWVLNLETTNSAGKTVMLTGRLDTQTSVLETAGTADVLGYEIQIDYVNTNRKTPEEIARIIADDNAPMGDPDEYSEEESEYPHNGSVFVVSRYPDGMNGDEQFAAAIDYIFGSLDVPDIVFTPEFNSQSVDKTGIVFDFPTEQGGEDLTHLNRTWNGFNAEGLDLRYYTAEVVAIKFVDGEIVDAVLLFDVSPTSFNVVNGQPQISFDIKVEHTADTLELAKSIVKGL